MSSFWNQDLRFYASAVTVALPFVSFLLIMIFTRARPRLSGALSLGSISISMILALILLFLNRSPERPVQYAGRWLISGDAQISFGFLLDPLSLLMLALVGVIAFLVQLYSLGYMAGDPGFSRYYAFQSLFAWAMLSLCISSSMLQLYVFWELVGLSSYLLIGFWYERFSATQAGKKAFVMTRLGDVGFLIAILLILVHLGNADILDLIGREGPAGASPGFVTLVALLIFAAVIGKSAQFPLLTWLPDAMEGPTPVSALLHSATMVAAGVFLLARLFPFLALSPTAMTVFLAIGTISMLIASTMAMVNRDIKQVWAYSTISQLGLMIMAISAGNLFAGAFHLTTHAGFKALLFLCSGVWIHRFGTNDVYKMADFGGRKMKIPAACLVVAVAALAGLPPLSGFFSKEAVMASLAGLSNPIWLWAGLLGIFLTSYYAFRIVFILLSPRWIREPDHSGKHGESHYLILAMPLVVLAVMTIVLGFLQEPLHSFLSSPPGIVVPEGHDAWLLYVTLGASIAGVLLSWLEFGRRGAAQVGFVERIPALRDLFGNRWYLDHVYSWVVKILVDGFLARLSARNESRVIDRSIDRFSRLTLECGRVTTFLQSGILRHNVVLLFAAILIVTLYFLFD
ncbi:MAG: NADH-quinone oxidoreductase subunit L [Desulfobacteraceae bacterium]|nr:MAG: NADH-quinone oxidoreductase subunit L [Desulfobacteraceae bacterium]